MRRRLSAHQRRRNGRQPHGQGHRDPDLDRRGERGLQTPSASTAPLPVSAAAAAQTAKAEATERWRNGPAPPGTAAPRRPPRPGGRPTPPRPARRRGTALTAPGAGSAPATGGRRRCRAASPTHGRPRRASCPPGSTARPAADTDPAGGEAGRRPARRPASRRAASAAGWDGLRRDGRLRFGPVGGVEPPPHGGRERGALAVRCSQAARESVERMESALRARMRKAA